MKTDKLSSSMPLIHRPSTNKHAVCTRVELTSKEENILTTIKQAPKLLCKKEYCSKQASNEEKE